jgi:hypothetical protein
MAGEAGGRWEQAGVGRRSERIRRLWQRGFPPCFGNSMLMHLDSNPILPVNLYVQLANACKDVQANNLNGSGSIVRAKHCCFCARTIKLGAGSTNFSLQQHMLSHECQKSQKKFADSDYDLSFLLSDLNLPSLNLATPTPSVHLSSLLEPYYRTDSPPLAVGYLRHNLQPELSETCPGALVDYGMSLFSHYPWHLHDLALLDYGLRYIDPKGRFIRICSNQCYQKSPGRGAACEECNRVVLGRQLQDLVKRASLDPSTVPSINLLFWTYSQLSLLLKEKSSKLNGLKLKV